METKSLPDLPELMPKKPNGAGMAALALGVMAVVVACTVWGIPFAILLGLAAAVCGGIGRAKVKRGTADEGGAALAGLIIGTIVAVACIGVTVWFINGLSHINDRPEDLVSGGDRYETPLGPGGTARYRDGMKVTVGKARRVPNLPGDVALVKGDITYEFAVTYVNDQKKTLPLASNGIRSEEKVLPENRFPAGPMSPEWDRHHPWFPDELAPHQKVTVMMHINVPPGSTSLDFTCAPTDYRDEAHWLLPLHEQ
ncbi:DUF4190 domain-containing protein [Streptomyces sp. NPDC008001]|uniref:DUF4190 domain-containing protein n=1 Tax=Streptomyces sp. NPDC008001 TaxID=3364804 RepID=UPI0036E009EE